MFRNRSSLASEPPRTSRFRIAIPVWSWRIGSRSARDSATVSQQEIRALFRDEFRARALKTNPAGRA